MATTTQRAGKKGKQQFNHSGYRSGTNGGGGVRDHYNSYQAAPISGQSNLPGVYSNPDMAYALVNMVGCVVDVRMQSGKVYQGVLKAVSHKLSIALALAHDKSAEMSTGNTEKLMQLEFADVVSVSALNEHNPNLTSIDVFKTDTEISRSNGPSLSREFQPFSFEDDNQSTLHLDDGSRGWSAEEMFETNRNKFQVESSYDEAMTEYTTKLDRSDTKDYQEREERAAKLAREIELNPGNQKIKNLENCTEEELFSSVARIDYSSFPPLSHSSASSSSSAGLDPCKGTADPSSQTKAESSSTSPSMNGHSQRAAEAAPSTQHSQTVPDPTPIISAATSSSSLSSAADPAGVPQEAGTGLPYLSAVMNGRTNQHNGATAKDDEETWPMVGMPRADADSTSCDESTSCQGVVAGGTETVMGQEGMLGSVSVASETVMEGVSTGEEVPTAENQQQQILEVSDVESEKMSSSVSGLSQTHEEQIADVSGALPKENVVEGKGKDEETAVADVEASVSTESLKLKEADKKVKDFTLNPDAKSFTFNPNAKEFVPKLDQSSQSVSPVHQDPPTHRHVSSHPGKRYPKVQNRSNYSQDHGSSFTPAYLYNQPHTQQQVQAVMGRAPVPPQGPAMQQFSPQHYHPSYSVQAGNFAPPPPQGIINPPPQVLAPQQKFYGDVGAIYPGQQQYSVPMNHQHIMQQPTPHSLAFTGPLLTSASQPALITSHAPLVGTPGAGGMVFMQQGAAQVPPGTTNPSMYSPMMVPQQVGNPATSADMMGATPFYQ